MHDENRNKKPKESFRFKPIDFLRGKSHIELSSNTSATLEGSKGVLEYSTECIRISLDNFIVTFSGRNLTLKCISPTALTIQGYILNVNFSD